MTQATATAISASENSQRSVVTVPAPQAGQELAVSAQDGAALEFEFDPSVATATRPEGGNDLVFELDNGGRVVITGFFETGGQALPNLVLPDGTEVASADFFAGSDMNLETAAGPGGGSAASGGTNYEDSAGDLLGGLGRLATLGTDYWNAEREYSEIDTGLIGEAVAPAPDLTIYYSVRAVLYIDPSPRPMMAMESIGTQYAAVQFRLVNAATGQSYTTQELESLTWALEDENGFFNLDSLAFDPETGIFRLTLSEAGFAALRGAADSGNLYEYITITVDGQTYTMQVVVNQSGYFDSQTEDALNPPVDGSLIHGEFHTDPRGINNGERASTEGMGDEVWFEGNYAGFEGELNLGGGDNTATIHGATMGLANARIVSQGGDDKITISGNYYGAQNSSVNTGSGEGDEISISGATTGVRSSDGNAHEVKAVDGTVGISAATSGTAYGIAATGGSSLDVEAAEVTVSAQSTEDTAYGVLAQGEGVSNTITATADAAITAESSGMSRIMYAAEGGKNVVTSGGDITLTGTSSTSSVYGIQATAGSSNSIEAAGKVSITAQTSGSGSLFTIGMVASGADAVNTITAKEVDITANTGAYGRALNAQSGGVNRILGREGELLTVNFAVNETGMFAYQTGSANTVSGHELDMTVTGATTAMHAYLGGKNTIEATGDGADKVDLTGTVLAQDGENIINIGQTLSEGGRDTVVIKGRVQASDSNAANPSANTIITGDLNIAASDGINALSAVVASGGTSAANTVNASGNAHIETTGLATNSTAIDAWVSYQDAASGGSAENIVNAGGDLTLKAVSNASVTPSTLAHNDIGIKGVATHVDRANSLAKNTVTAQNLFIEAVADAGNLELTTTTAYGIYGRSGPTGTGASAVNNLTVEELASITVAANVATDTNAGAWAYGAAGMMGIGLGGDATVANTLQAGGVHMDVTNNLGTAAGMFAGLDSVLGQGGTVNNTIIVTGQGVEEGQPGLNINVSGNIAYGLSAIGSGASNTITMAEGASPGLSLSVDAEGMSRIVYAASGGENTLTSGGDVTLTGTSSTTHVYGIQATAGSSNSIEAGGKVSITSTTSAQSGSIFTLGMHASGAEAVNTITAKGVDITANTGTGRAMNAQSGGVNQILGREGELLTVNFDVNNIGMYTTGAGSSNTVSGHGLDMTIAGASMAMSANAGGKNTIEATGDGADKVDLTGNVIALGGENIINIGQTLSEGGRDTVVIKGRVQASDTATATGANTITTADLSIASTAGVDALSAAISGTGASATNTINASGDALIEVSGPDAEDSRAISASTNWSSESGSLAENIVNVGGKLTVRSTSTSYVDSPFMSGTDSGMRGVAACADGEGTWAKNTIRAKSMSIEAVADTGDPSDTTAAAYGIYGRSGPTGTGASAVNNLTVEELASITVAANVGTDNNAYGWAYGAAGMMGIGLGEDSTVSNTLQAGGVRMDVSNDKGTAAGMFAGHDSLYAKGATVNNTITVTGQGVAEGQPNLVINVSGETAYGMSAIGSEASNTITVAEGASLALSLSADGTDASYAMYAASGGANTILGGVGDDNVALLGDIWAGSGGSNSIDAGDGNDFIHLHGDIGTGALTLNAGGGNDTLILEAADKWGFNNSYESWATSHGIGDMDVESITVRLNDIGERDSVSIGWLHSGAGQAEVSYDWTLKSNLSTWTSTDLYGTASDHDVLRLHADGKADDLLSLFGKVAIGGFEQLVVDLTGETADTLSLDVLLGKINTGNCSDVKEVFVNTDVNDSLEGLGNLADYTHEQSTVINGITYDVYSSDEITLYIQQHIGG